MTSDERNPAPTRPCSLLRRIAAMIYDGLLLVALWMVAAVIVIIPMNEAISPGNPLFQLYLLFIAWGYFAICWRKGQTLGMKAWRIRIVSAWPVIGWLPAVVRFIVALASLMCFGLGFLWSLFHPRNATWHDLASATYLVVVPKRGAKELPREP